MGEEIPTFGELPLVQVDGAAAAELDLALSKQDRARATRSNVQIVLRSVLRFATSRGYLAGLPPALPRLKAAEKRILEIPSERDIDTILASAVPSQRLAFALMAYAGLRPNEVRALRRRDVLLPGTNRGAQGGFVSVREGRSYGETHTPKTGQREIPITAPLVRLLEHVERGPKDGRVALNQQGKPSPRLLRALSLLQRTGWPGLLGALASRRASAPDVTPFPPDLLPVLAAVGNQPRVLEGLARELEAGDACEQEVRALPAHVGIPLRLIVSSAPLGPDEPLPPNFPRDAYNRLWQEASAEMLALSADATLIRAERSDHLIQLHEPELVEDVVRALLEHVRVPLGGARSSRGKFPPSRRPAR